MIYYFWVDLFFLLYFFHISWNYLLFLQLIKMNLICMSNRF